MNKLILFFLLLATSLGAAPATKFHDITRTTAIQSNSIFLVSTQDSAGRFRTRTIEGRHLATGLGLWITNSSATSGLTTNANQFLGVPLAIKSSALLTNTTFHGAITNNGSFTNTGDMDVGGNIGGNNQILRGDSTVRGASVVGNTLIVSNQLDVVNGSATGNSSFSTNLFTLGTNRARWLKLDGGQTASRALVLDSGTNVVAATGTADATTFLRGDNVYAVPPGSGTNIFTNVVYVNAVGTAAENGVALTNASFSMPLGYTLVVGPGEYYIPTNTLNLLPAIGKMYCYPGVKITKGLASTTDLRFLIDDGAGPITNEYSGYGEFYLTNGNLGAFSGTMRISQTTSKVRWEGNIMRFAGVGGSAVIQSGAGSELVYHARVETYSDNYDAFLVSLSGGGKCHATSTRVFAGGSIVEATGVPGVGATGDITFDIDYGEKLATGTTLGAVIVGENTYIRINVINIKANDSISSASTNCTSCVGNGVLEGSVIYSLPSSIYSTVRGLDPLYCTSFTLKGYTVYAPDGVDAFSIQTFNGTAAGAAFTVENVHIIEGASSTNWVRKDERAGNSGNVRISQSTSRRRFPAHTNVTILAESDLALTIPIDRLTLTNTTATSPTFSVYASNNPTPNLIVLSNGNVGLGVVSPTARLQVEGVVAGAGVIINGVGARSDPMLLVTNDATVGGAANSDKGLSINMSGGGNAATMSALAVKTGTTPLLWVGLGSTVGVGTTNAVNKLDVEGAVAIGATYSGTSTAPANGAIIEGNVGIGTASPSVKLNVWSADATAWVPNTTTPQTRLINSSAIDNEFSGLEMGGTYSDASYGFVKIGSVISAASSADFVVANRNAGTSFETFRIKNNGNIGIGTNAPASRLHVASDNASGVLVAQFGTTNLPSLMTLDTNGIMGMAYGTLYRSNTVAMPTAATLGLGGYWVGNSNGFLVSVYTLNGTTTAMKVLAP